MRSFKSQINIGDLNGKDIPTIQKALTNLGKWVISFAKDNDILVIEDFFQRLRILLTDMLIKLHGTQLKSYQMDIHHLRWLLVEMVARTHDYQEQLRTIIPRMRGMGINNCYVYLYNKPVVFRRGDVWENPKMVNLVMAYNEEICELPKSGRQIKWENILNHEWLPRDKRYTMIFCPLFVEDEHLGLILMRFNMANVHMFRSLVFEMSCALKLSLLFHQREQIDNRLQKVVKELKKYNQKLNKISQSLNLARKRGKNGLLFFADMDGLKKINDQYGHEEGDIAIKAMGSILVKTFRASDIISRIGGDEFTIFTVDSDLKLLPTIQERMQKFINEYNFKSGRPYPISITIGAVPFNSRENTTIEYLMVQADKVLYEQKNQKRAANNAPAPPESYKDD